MDIQTLKIDLARRILSSQNASLLHKIESIFQKEVETDWWDQLPKEVQDSINEGIQDIEKGHVLTHQQVIHEAKEKYGF